jgi:hypothetical protein
MRSFVVMLMRYMAALLALTWLIAANEFTLKALMREFWTKILSQ